MNLWMRWLDFRALRDLLLLVGEHPDGLRASELERLATDEQVLLRRDGRPYARSIHYHHRRTLERLGLLEKRDRHYVLNHRNPETGALTTKTRVRERLHPSEKKAFANAVIRNKDCHDVFLGNFLPAREAVCDVTTFVERAHPAEIVIQSVVGRAPGRGSGQGHDAGHARSKRVAIRPTEATSWSVLDGAVAVQAIHFGLRSWCVDKLGFLDIVCGADGTYTAYPKHIVTRLPDQELAVKMFADLEFADDWATIRVPDCALATGIKQRVSIDQAKSVLMHWLTGHPDLVAGVPTRVAFITAGLPDRQHDLALKSYLRSNSGAYLSHVRIHRMLHQHVQNGVQGHDRHR